MKLLVIVLFAVIGISSSIPLDNYVVMRQKLQVPEDPDSWVFNGDTRNPKRGSRISNGWQATDTQFPWTVEQSINFVSGGVLCTASLISNRWLVGARHCIADEPVLNVQNMMGSASRQGNRLTYFSDLFVWLDSATGMNHPDIALFRLSQNVQTSSTIYTVRLPARSQQDSTFEGTIMTASGWGGIGNNELSNYLQWAEFRVIPRSQCSEQYFTSIYLCSQPPSGSASLEGGDSGGPSVIYENGTPTLIGVNVFYVTGASVWQGSTRVGAFLDFISTTTGIPIRN